MNFATHFLWNLLVVTVIRLISHEIIFSPVSSQNFVTYTWWFFLLSFKRFCEFFCSWGFGRNSKRFWSQSSVVDQIDWDELGAFKWNIQADKLGKTYYVGVKHALTSTNSYISHQGGAWNGIFADVPSSSSIELLWATSEARRPLSTRLWGKSSPTTRV